MARRNRRANSVCLADRRNPMRGRSWLARHRGCVHRTTVARSGRESLPFDSPDSPASPRSVASHSACPACRRCRARRVAPPPGPTQRSGSACNGAGARPTPWCCRAGSYSDRRPPRRRRLPSRTPRWRRHPASPRHPAERLPPISSPPAPRDPAASSRSASSEPTWPAPNTTCRPGSSHFSSAATTRWAARHRRWIGAA